MTASIHPPVESADAVELLYAAHERIRHLIREFERAHVHCSQREAHAYARRLCRELEIHSTVEEEIFYPEMRRLLEDAGLVNTARLEHELFRRLIERISAQPVLDSEHAAEVGALCENVMRHMRDEEDHMFGLARVAELDMYEIGARIRARELDLRLDAHAGDEWLHGGARPPDVRDRRSAS